MLQGLFCPYRTPKILGKKGKNAQKTQGNPRKETKQGIPKKKQPKGPAVLETLRRSDLLSP